MLLGKRPRPPMRRTTSMKGITVDVSGMEASEPLDEQNVRHAAAATGGADGSSAVAISTSLRDHSMMMNSAAYDQRVLAMVSPRNQRTNSRDFVETADFLRTCGLCKSRLAAGRDIYMYRGDTAFCSLECREQQMKQDERKERYGVVSSSRSENQVYHRHHGASSTA